MSQLKVNSIVDASGGSNAVLYGPASPAGSMGFRNRTINGNMVIDQRNAGAAVTSGYPVDRFQMSNTSDGTFSAQQDSSAPAGFTKSLKVTITSADSSLTTTQRLMIIQQIEGYNVADFNFGTANAKTVTLSFWVRCSLTGTFGGSLVNGGSNRSYPFTYSISAANTWEYKTVTVAGDTTGTWATDNSSGMRVYIGLGAGPDTSGTAGAWAGANYTSATGATSVVGTNGATFYITGVQLEVGSVATEFERRPYGTELALCQRYYWELVRGDAVYFTNAWQFSSDQIYAVIQFPVTMRSTPSLASNSGSNYYIFYRNGGSDPFDSFTLNFASKQTCSIANTTQISGTAGDAGGIISNGGSAMVAFSAEL